nr:PREDICTED: GPI-anchor transamidase [Anolis carolinensis]|eukprot:XP_016850398.1 PREDICTED: GPI-anchor transamidase [Anolis carolinensis]
MSGWILSQLADSSRGSWSFKKRRRDKSSSPLPLVMRLLNMAPSMVLPPCLSAAKAAAVLLGCFTLAIAGGAQEQAEQFFRSGHTNNWAVLVCTSRFWFNYRHVANTLSVYRSVKRLGIPDR